MLTKGRFIVRKLFIKIKKNPCKIVLMSWYWNHQERRTLTAWKENRKWIGRIFGRAKDHRKSPRQHWKGRRRKPIWINVRLRKQNRTETAQAADNNGPKRREPQKTTTPKRVKPQKTTTKTAQAAENKRTKTAQAAETKGNRKRALQHDYSILRSTTDTDARETRNHQPQGRRK